MLYVRKHYGMGWPREMIDKLPAVHRRIGRVTFIIEVYDVVVNGDIITPIVIDIGVWKG
jgi:hypothetical protein